MMSSPHILRAALLGTLLIPGAALAYLSPEEVLSSDQNAGIYFDRPPTPRQAQAAQAAQQSSDAARRKAEQDALMMTSSASSSSVDDTLHSAAPVDGSTTSLSATDQRILERVKADQMRAEIEARAQVLASQQSLHGGAPLANSGPASTTIAFLLAGAGIWTIWKARRMEVKR